MTAVDAARPAPGVPGFRSIAQGIPPATTQSELYGGWASAALVVVVFTWWTYRRRSPQRLALKAAAQCAAAHWALQRTTADRCSLTNTSPEPAREVTVTIRPRGQHGPLAFWINMFGLHALSDRLRQRHPNRRAQILHPAAATLVANGSSIELQLRSSAKDGWLEVEWRQPDDTSNWTKYAIPSSIGQTSTTG